MNKKDVLARFEAAVRAEEMCGSQDPEDRPLIQEEYEQAKAEIEHLLGIK